VSEVLVEGAISAE